MRSLQQLRNLLLDIIPEIRSGKIEVNKSEIDQSIEFIIPDTREGWVESIKILIKSYFEGKNQPYFNYSKIRPFGAPIKTFGGISSGYESLKKLHDDVREVLNKNVGKPITETCIVARFVQLAAVPTIE